MKKQEDPIQLYYFYHGIIFFSRPNYSLDIMRKYRLATDFEYLEFCHFQILSSSVSRSATAKIL
jgi:hypothetical protein